MRLRSLVCISRLKNGLQLLLRCSLFNWIYRMIRSMTLVLLSSFNFKLQISIWPLEDVHKSANDILDDAN